MLLKNVDTGKVHFFYCTANSVLTGPFCCESTFPPPADNLHKNVYFIIAPSMNMHEDSPTTEAGMNVKKSTDVG